MSEKPILFVASLGRSGTTMLMTMLDRGGFPCAGPRPAYEVDEMGPVKGVDKAWVRQQSGRAVKWIDPTVARISRNDLPVRPIIIHMDRDTGNIARSQAKLMETFFGLRSNRNTIDALARSIANDKPKLAALLDNLGTAYSFTFEFVLREPLAAAQKLKAILNHEFSADFDLVAAANVVKNRGPECAIDMRIEMGMTP